MPILLVDSSNYDFQKKELETIQTSIDQKLINESVNPYIYHSGDFV